MATHEDIFDALNALVADITAAGIPATLDPRDLQVPGALVELEGVDPLLYGDLTARAAVYLVAPDNGRSIATAAILEMAARISHLVKSGTAIDLALPDTGPLPCMKFDSLTID